MFRKMVACLLTAVMITGLLAVPAAAEEIGTSDEVQIEAAAEEIGTPDEVQIEDAVEEFGAAEENEAQPEEPAAAGELAEAGDAALTDAAEEEAEDELSPEMFSDEWWRIRAQIQNEIESQAEPVNTMSEESLLQTTEEEETLYTEYAFGVPEGTYYFISGVGTNMVLDIKGASTSKSANAQIYKKNNTEAQQFKVEKVNSYYRIVNVKSGMCLDVYGGSKANKANVQQYPWNGTNAQLWYFEDAGNGYFYVRNVGSDKALDVYGGRTANGTNVHQYTANGTNAQKWKLTTLSGTPVSGTMEETEGPNSYVGQGGTYHIFSMVNTAYAVDVYGGSTQNKANVQLYKYNGTGAQSWVFAYQGNGYYKITNKKSGKALDVYGGRTANKTNVHQYTWNGSKAQLWKIKENGDDSCQLVSALGDNIVLDLYGGKAANKRNIQIYRANGTKAQQWTLYPEGSSPQGSGSSGEEEISSEAVANPNSIYILVNKKHPLPDGYEPSDLVVPNVLSVKTVYLRSEAAVALKTMFDAAKQDGVYLKAGSGYRSYSTQASLYESYVAMDGTAAADRYSARPGYSEHQTGLAMDISDYDESYYLETSFAYTEEGMWLAENAYKYGWILRYPSTKESVTGYMYEPWHFRYVGVATATAIYNKGSEYTYEEYTGVSGGGYN